MLNELEKPNGGKGGVDNENNMEKREKIRMYCIKAYERDSDSPPLLQTNSGL